MGTAKGYTGQYADATELDYYNARYYDPVAASFLSADSVEGNPQGLDPYSYVQGNPETATDPSGQRIDFGSGEQGIVNFRTGQSPFMRIIPTGLPTRLTHKYKDISQAGTPPIFQINQSTSNTCHKSDPEKLVLS